MSLEVTGTTGMKHRNLDAKSIRALVSEDKQVRGLESDLDGTLRKIENSVLHRLVGGRKKLTQRELVDIVEDINETIRSGIRPVAGRSQWRKTSKAKSHKDMFVSHQVAIWTPTHIEGAADIYELFGLKIVASTAGIDVKVTSFPMAFKYHAAERVLERAVNAQEAIHRIGASLVGMATVVREAAKTEHIVDLHLPDFEAGGLLAGQFYKPFLPKEMHLRFDVRGSEKTFSNPDIQRYFIVKTFVGNSLLRPAPADAVGMLSSWKEKHDIGGRSSWESLYRHSHDFEADRAPEEATAEIQAILDAPRYLSQISRSGAHGANPGDPSYFQTWQDAVSWQANIDHLKARIMSPGLK